MIYDCHLHTEFSGDCETPVRKQIEAAIRLGMKELCITDHHDFDSGFCDTDFILDLPAYLRTLKEIRKEYAGTIQINIGIELGLQNHLTEYLHEFVKTHGSSFDFILGSSHFIHRMDPYEPAYWQTYGTQGGLSEFFRISLERAQNLSDCFDSFTHLDYAVRYLPQQQTAYSYEAYQEFIDPLLKTLIDRQKALECNTGGYAYGLGQPNPCAAVLRRYHSLGGELITIGSDAHKPEHLGYGFDQCRKLLLACGFRCYTVFRGRKPYQIPL